jgi:hypothetical protein
MSDVTSLSAPNDALQVFVSLRDALMGVKKSELP